MPLTVNSPAKINLALQMGPLKEDGYHRLNTVFTAVTLFDRLTFKTGGREINVKMNPPIDGPPESNLIFRGASLLREKFCITRGVEITAEKKIPPGGGLGGGSGNGASTLLALNHLWNLNLSKNNLSKLAALLGSDVPFFTGSSLAFGTGRGEDLREIPLTEDTQLHFLLVCPPFSVSTAKAFQWWDEEGCSTENPKWEAMMEALQKNDPEALGPLLFNDLEMPVIRKFPQIARIKEQLMEAKAMGALMSGSGSSVFGLFTNRQEAGEAIPKVKDLGLVYYVNSIRGPAVRINYNRKDHNGQSDN